MSYIRKICSLLAPLFLSCPLHAGEGSLADKTFPPAKAGFQLRLDAVRGQTKTDGAPTKEPEGLIVKTARMAVFGDLTDTLSYFIRLDAAAPLYTTNYVGPDGAVAALERAYFTQKWTDWLTMRAGRIPTLCGSVEIDYSSMDQYVNSHLLDQYVTRIFPTTTGLEFAAGAGVHTFTAQLVDGFQEETGPHRGTQTGSDMTWTLGYRAKLLDGMVKPILTYDHAGRVRASEGASRDDEVFFTAVGAGAQFSYAHADLDLEYDTLNRPAFTSHRWDTVGAMTVVNNKEMKEATVVGQVAYTFEAEHLRSFIKWSQDHETIAGQEHLRADHGGIGVEYRPLAPRNFRYHLVIADKKDIRTNADETRAATTTLQYIVGMAAKI